MPPPNPFPHYFTCANVRDFGAQGDGIANDTAAIQAAIDSLKYGPPPLPPPPNPPGVYAGLGLVFPNGKYLIRGTLLFDNLVGVHVIGAGTSPSTSQLNVNWHVGTAIIVDVSEDPNPYPILHFQGCAGVRVSGLFLVGRSDYVPIPFAKAGIKVSTAGGRGSDYLFTDVGVTLCEDGVVVGDGGQASALSSDMTFIRYSARYCNRGFVAKHNQALNYNFVSPAFQACDDGFVFERTNSAEDEGAGGSMIASQVAGYNLRRLVVSERAGSNIGVLVVNQARLDSDVVWGGNNRTILYERIVDPLKLDWPARIVLNAVSAVWHEGGADDPRLIVGPGDHVSLNNCTALDTIADLSPPTPAIGLNIRVYGSSGDKWAIVDLTGCYLEEPGPTKVVGTVDVGAKYRVRLRNTITYPEAPTLDVDYGTTPAQWITQFAEATVATVLSAANAYQDVVGTGLLVEANTDYSFEFALLCSSTAANPDIMVACNGPSGFSSLQFEQVYWSSLNARSSTGASSYDANGSQNSSQALSANIVRLYRVRGVLRNGANAGTLIGRLQSSIVPGANTASALIGSYGMLTKLS